MTDSSLQQTFEERLRQQAKELECLRQELAKELRQEAKEREEELRQEAKERRQEAKRLEQRLEQLEDGQFISDSTSCALLLSSSPSPFFSSSS